MEKARFVIHIFCPEAKIDKTYTTVPISKEMMEKIVDSLTNPTRDAVIPIRGVSVGQEQRQKDQVILKQTLLEMPMIIETGVREN